MKKVLITAFEAFNDEVMNPTEAVLAELPEFLFDARVIKVTLPVVYDKVFETLEPFIKKHEPKLILMMGLAAGRSQINLERVAINMNDAQTKDNLGNIKHFDIIDKNGPDGIFTTLPLEKIVMRTRKKKLPVTISNTAGTYVCNHLMYKTLLYVKEHFPNTKAGFIHMPFVPEQVLDKPNTPCLDKRYMIDTMTTIMDVILNPMALEQAQRIMT